MPQQKNSVAAYKISMLLLFNDNGYYNGCDNICRLKDVLSFGVQVLWHDSVSVLSHPWGHSGC